MRVPAAAAAFAFSLACVAAHADPVTYTLTGTVDGTLGVTSFTDAAVTLTLVGDTANISSLGAGYYTNDAGTATIQIAGVGTATFTGTTFGVESEQDGAGFSDTDVNSGDPNYGFALSVYDPSLSNYALTAPFTDTSYLLESFYAASGATESTSLGALSITNVDSADGTFTASSIASAATPEPSSLMLLGTAFAGMAGVLRRRRA